MVLTAGTAALKKAVRKLTNVIPLSSKGISIKDLTIHLNYYLRSVIVDCAFLRLPELVSKQIQLNVWLKYSGRLTKSIWPPVFRSLSVAGATEFLLNPDREAVKLDLPVAKNE